MAKVLKALYFKKTDFLNAKLGHKPSFIWRSILWGRQMLHQGLRWRIGNGEQVKIYNCNWIPRPSTFKIVSAPTLPLEATVFLFINDEHNWNEALIKQQFMSEDVDCNLKMMLPRTLRPDQSIWAYDKHGNYLVKSGYQVALRLKFPDYPGS